MPTISVHRTDLESLIETSMERGGTAHKPVTHQREQISTERLEELLQCQKKLTSGAWHIISSIGDFQLGGFIALHLSRWPIIFMSVKTKD